MLKSKLDKILDAGNYKFTEYMYDGDEVIQTNKRYEVNEGDGKVNIYYLCIDNRKNAIECSAICPFCGMLNSYGNECRHSLYELKDAYLFTREVIYEQSNC